MVTGGDEPAAPPPAAPPAPADQGPHDRRCSARPGGYPARPTAARTRQKVDLRTKRRRNRRPRPGGNPPGPAAARIRQKVDLRTKRRRYRPPAPAADGTAIDAPNGRGQRLHRRRLR